MRRAAFRSGAVISAALISILFLTLLAISKATNHDLRRGIQQGSYLGLGTDGWFERVSEINYTPPHLAKFSNPYIQLTFDTWRPPNFQDNRLTVEVCGETIEINVARGTQARVSIAACDRDIVMKLNFERGFRVAGGDKRILAAKLKDISIGSSLSIFTPRVDVLFFYASIFVGFFAFVVWSLKNPVIIAPLLLLHTYLFLNFSFYNFTQYMWLLFAGVLILFGIKVGSFIIRQDDVSPVDGGREEFPRRSFYYCLALILIVAAAIRFYGIDFGLPYHFHPDESRKVNVIMKMHQEKTLDPDYFLHPSLLLYLSSLNSHLVGLLSTANPSQAVLLGGRFVSACAGVLSVLLCALSARILFGGRAALIASSFLCFSPLHIASSRYMKEDSLLLFCTMLSFYLILKAAFEKRTLFIYLSAIAAGLAAGSKYTGALTGVFPLAAPWLVSGSIKPSYKILLHALASLPLVPLAFLITTPFAIFNYSKFITDLNFERTHMLIGHMHVIDAWSQYWMYHLSYSLIPGLSPIVTFISLIGIGALIARARIAGLFVVAAALIFYLPAEWVKAKPAPQAERYIYQCLPFFAISAAYMFSMLLKAAGNSRLKLAVNLLLLLTLLFPTWRSFSLAREIYHDTRLTAGSWLVENARPGTKALFELPWYSPHFRSRKIQVKYISRDDLLGELSIERLKASGADYLVISGLFFERYFKQPNSSLLIRHLYRRLFYELPIVNIISSKAGSYGFHNPRIVIFSLKKSDLESFEKNRAQALGLNQALHGSFFDNCGLSRWLTARSCERIS